MLKAIFSIFQLSPARREDYLKVNELLETHESKSVAYLFPHEREREREKERESERE